MKKHKISRNDPCPCGSGKKYKKCCGLFHDGKALPPPEKLMRARYSAYVLGLHQFIIDTTHLESPHLRDDRKLWLNELTEHHKRTHYTSLVVEENKELQDEAWVSFTVTFEQDGVAGSRGERSYFLRQDGQWKYVYGLRKPC